MSALGTILVADDGSPEARGAGLLAERIAQAEGAPLTYAHVVEDPRRHWFGRSIPDEVDTRLGEQEERWRLRLEERCAARAGRRAVVRRGDPAPTLLQLAGEIGAGAIALGAHERGALERILLGSVARRVVDHAPCPVLLCRQAEPSTSGEVLVAAEGPASSPAAREVAERLAALLGARLRVASGALPTACAEHPPMLAVVGSREPRGVGAAGPRSATRAVADAAPCPVLIVRGTPAA